jgi:transcriptional regulator with XRE-family HTH domain
MDGIEVKNAIKRSGLKLGKVAELMGISAGSLSRKLHQRGSMRLTPDNLAQLQQILGSTLSKDREVLKPVRLTKQEKLIKVEASESHVREHWRIVIFEGQQEICVKDDVSLYFNHSDWSEAYPLTQKICQVVFNGSNDSS